MKKFISILFIAFIGFSSIVGCTDNDDKPSDLPIQSFIWKGLNSYYLYQQQVPDLADNKFKNQNELDNYLSNYSKPENLFENLIYDRKNTDKFSWIVSNYIELEQQLQGTSKSNGVEYGLKYKSATSNEIFGYVKYIMPNSDASTKAIQRGTIFYGINGTPLTDKNYQSLLGGETYTLNLADYDNGNITPNDQSVSLTKTIYTENPVLLKNVYTVGTKKVGYLIYNGFYSNFETELNDAFGYFKSENITDFVLDLRYNSGGSVATATRLGSMITGQFEGQLFSQQQWNSKLQPKLSQSSLVENFTNTIGNGAPINSINMKKVYILTTGSTASASELVMNCLKPYITVVQIGSKTVGKNVGSVTLYDSPNYRREGANPNHAYAMQPIVLKVLNRDGFGEYQAGFTSEITTNNIPENLGDLGQLGDENELYLAKALSLASARVSSYKLERNYKTFKEVNDLERNLDSEMYIEKLPNGFENIFK
jgi:carboxyl-terminal processing protease